MPLLATHEMRPAHVIPELNRYAPSGCDIGRYGSNGVWAGVEFSFPPLLLIQLDDLRFFGKLRVGVGVCADQHQQLAVGKTGERIVELDAALQPLQADYLGSYDRSLRPTNAGFPSCAVMNATPIT
jgi:hypothetical protein